MLAAEVGLNAINVGAAYPSIYWAKRLFDALAVVKIDLFKL